MYLGKFIENLSLYIYGIVKNCRAYNHEKNFL